MGTFIYTTEIIAELAELAEETRQLDVEWRAVMADVQAHLLDVAGFDFTHWTGPRAGETERVVDLAWTARPELSALAAAAYAEYRLPNLMSMPRAGDIGYKNIQRPAEWRKLNNRCRRDIAKAREALDA